MVSTRRTVKRAAIGILGTTYVSRNRIRFGHSGERLLILNLHRIGSGQQSTYKGLDPDLFIELLDFLSGHYELMDFAALTEGVPKNRRKPPAILSFDDGYADFVETAAPILQARNIRANLNVIPECIESGVPPFNVAIQDYVGSASDEEVDQLLTSIGLQRISSRTLSRDQLGIRLSRQLKNMPMEQQVVLRGKINPEVLREIEAKAEPMMRLEDLLVIAEHHEIGVHSYSHATMAHESDDVFERDLEMCITWYQDLFHATPVTYAFPNGSAKPNQIESVLHRGIAHALLVGDNYSSTESRIHERFNFHAESRSEMRFRASGALAFK